jgi:hypothetical protein
VTDFAWNPDTFLRTMQDEIPGYTELQEAFAWLDDAGCDAGARYVRPDLAVLTARRR